MSIRHLVILEGQGDADIGLVTPEQFAWINSPYPRGGRPSWIEHDPGDGHEVIVTCGSGDNDRALQANKTEFGSMAAVIAYMKKHDLELSPQEFYGCIY